MTLRVLLVTAGLALLGGCKKDAAPSASPTAGKVAWDDPAKASAGLDWPMSGVPAASAGGTQSFGRGDGGSHTSGEVWQKLGVHAETFLKTWRSQLREPSAAPSEVLDAFNELAYQITGPTGFWRKTLPQQWLGCSANPDSEACVSVAKVLGELSQWDDIQKRIGGLEASQAKAFLERNAGRMLAYLETYVPAEASSSGMKDTDFYKKKLASILDSVVQ